MTVTVIGAGIVGCAVACELARRGARVRVIDVRGTGRGATHASAGMLPPAIEGHSPALFQLGLASLALYDDFIARLRGEGAPPFEYARTGSLQVAFDAAGADDLTRLADRLTGDGIDHDVLDAAAIRRLEPQLADSITTGLLIPQHGHVAAQALATALAESAHRLGAEFSTGCVMAVSAAGAHVAVRAEGPGVVESDAVVIAAGSWSGHICGDGVAAVPVKPIRGQLVHLKAAHPVATRAVWGASCYIVPWRDGTVLVGATVEDVGFAEEATASGVRSLLTAATSVMPSLDAAAFVGVRTGLRPLTPDELPVIGPASTTERVVYATGHYRNGVLLAPLTARLVGDFLVDRRHGPELALTCPARFGL